MFANSNSILEYKKNRFDDFMCKYTLILGALVVGAMVASGGSLAAILATVIIATGISISICAIINLSNVGALPDSISKTRGPEDGWNVDITEINLNIMLNST